MNYTIDLARIPITEYRDLLKSQNLLPGRRLLRQDIDAHFDAFASCGMKTAEELKKELSSPKKLATLAARSGISEEYLTLLKRELGSLDQRPVALSSFPDTDNALIETLSARGIKTSKDVFESGMSENAELFCMCDLVRINGVGPAAAKAFFEAGYCCVSDIAEADAAEMLKKISSVNSIKRYYKANLGEKDMAFCIEAAKLLLKYGG